MTCLLHSPREICANCTLSILSFIGRSRLKLLSIFQRVILSCGQQGRGLGSWMEFGGICVWIRKGSRDRLGKYCPLRNGERIRENPMDVGRAQIVSTRRFGLPSVHCRLVLLFLLGNTFCDLLGSRANKFRNSEYFSLISNARTYPQMPTKRPYPPRGSGSSKFPPR